MEQENQLAGQKNYLHNSREEKRKLHQHQKYWNLLWMLLAVLEQLEDIQTMKKHKKEFIGQW